MTNNLSISIELPNENNYRFCRSISIGEPQVWKKANFRKEMTTQKLIIKNVKQAKKCLAALQNEELKIRGGRFGGAAYRKSSKKMVQQAIDYLNICIESYEKKEVVQFPPKLLKPEKVNLFPLWIMLFLAIIFISLVIFVFWRRKKKKS